MRSVTPRAATTSRIPAGTAITNPSWWSRPRSRGATSTASATATWPMAHDKPHAARNDWAVRPVYGPNRAARVGLAAVLDREERGEVGDLEHPAGGLLQPGEDELTAALPGVLERRDEDSEPGRVDEPEAREVDDQLGDAPVDER